MYQPGDDAAHLIVPANPCTECEGEGRVCVGIDPVTYSGSGDSPRFRDVSRACSHCDGTGEEPTTRCAECGENCATRDPDLTLCDECVDDDQVRAGYSAPRSWEDIAADDAGVPLRGEI